jgi:hypothetical protein
MIKYMFGRNGIITNISEYIELEAITTGLAPNRFTNPDTNGP